MTDDEQIYKLRKQVVDRLGGNEIGASETVVLNDPYVLVEKLANMISNADLVVDVVPKDPGMQPFADKVKDFLYWWREEADSQWSNNLNTALSRDEIYYLALRGWVCGRIMLDPGDADFPWRYDLVDPIHVYPQRGGKSIRWVFHIYRDSKINVLNDLGWNNDLLQRIEEKLSDMGDEADVEVASYFDDVWHVLFVNEQEVWSAPHNYGFVPWIIKISFGPPIRRSDPVSGGRTLDTDQQGHTRHGGDASYSEWVGVSVFQGIKDVYQKLNKLASAVMTEAMKAPNPPIAMYGTPSASEEGKTIDTSIGATTHFVMGQEDFKPIQYGFRPSELAPLMQLLTSARDRGALPGVMYGEGAQYLSGFAVSVLNSGARDIMYPLLKSHERYLENLFKALLRITSELYPFPINMVASDPQTGYRSIMTTLTSDDIKQVGYTSRVYYRNVGLQDRTILAQTAAMLVDKKIISLADARGEQFLALRNPSLTNDKVLADLAWFNPKVVEASIPYALFKTSPELFVIYMNELAKAASIPPPSPFPPAPPPPPLENEGEPPLPSAVPPPPPNMNQINQV